ncbi:MAG TPA: alpha/beta hydrolase, partial [Gammaproteobacteria bacterium]
MSETRTVKVKWQDIFKPIPGFASEVTNRLDIEREVIPIIFVPGIMGSRLKNKSGNKVWDPDDKKFMVENFGLAGVSASERRKLLIG